MHTARAVVGPSTSFPVAGSTPIAPEQKIIPLQMMACEFEGLGAGAPVVRISVLSGIAFVRDWIESATGSEHRRDWNPEHR